MLDRFSQAQRREMLGSGQLSGPNWPKTRQPERVLRCPRTIRLGRADRRTIRKTRSEQSPACSIDPRRQSKRKSSALANLRLSMQRVASAGPLSVQFTVSSAFSVRAAMVTSSPSKAERKAAKRASEIKQGKQREFQEDIAAEVEQPQLEVQQPVVDTSSSSTKLWPYVRLSESAGSTKSLPAVFSQDGR